MKRLLAVLASVCVIATSALGLTTGAAKEDDSNTTSATPRPKTTKKSSATATPAPSASKKSASATETKKKSSTASDEPDSPSTQKKGSGTSAKKSAAGSEATKTNGEEPKPSVSSKESEKKSGANDIAAPSKTSAAIDPAAPPPDKVRSAANASITSKDLIEFNAQPDRVKKLIEGALALTRQNLTYIYGSADPASGGMDCSGFIYYLLREQGFSNVPRAANEQYIWVRKADEFDAVLSKKKQSFELDALLPGDLLFWTGTYTTERDPPVTHAMLYLGTERDTKQRVMAGSSDGRTYQGVARWGVSVFDFQGGQTSRDPAKAGRGGFVGYATIPGLRASSE
jgi:cell wall-associated NlpC family hydrolase